MEFGIVIVVYKPNISLLEKNIKTFNKITNHVVVVNNDDSGFELNNRCSIINLHRNRGIAFAQNEGVKFLSKAKVDYVFFLDQDSMVKENYFGEMLKVWEKIEKQNKKIGALAPSVYDRNEDAIIPIGTVNNGKQLNFSNTKIAVFDTLPISSGMLTKVSVFNEVGGNVANMFIDWVDFKYDMDLILHGFNVYTTPLISINHAVGNATKHHFLWKEVMVSNHAPFREYYFFRNGIYLIKTDGKKEHFIKALVVNMLLRRLAFLLYESNKWLRFKYITKGLIDGFRGKLNEV